MKLFQQTPILFAVALFAVASGQMSAAEREAPAPLTPPPVTPVALTPPPVVFDDPAPLATMTQPPQDECGSSKNLIGGMTSWQRGYNQAMSGTRYKVQIRNGGNFGDLKAKGCSEYKNSSYGAQEYACCMAGFGSGYKDLQQLISNSMAVPRKDAPESPAAMSCYGAFREGRTEGAANCAMVTKDPTGGCYFSHHKLKNSSVGCLTLGFLAELNQCPAVKAKNESMKYELSNGALSNLVLPPNRDIAGEEGADSATPAQPKASTADPVESKKAPAPLENL